MRFLRRAEQQHSWTGRSLTSTAASSRSPLREISVVSRLANSVHGRLRPRVLRLLRIGVHDGTDAGSAPSAGRRHDARRTRPRLLTVRHVGPALRPEAAAVPGSAHRRDHAHELADHPASRATPYCPAARSASGPDRERLTPRLSALRGAATQRPARWARAHDCGGSGAEARPATADHRAGTDGDRCPTRRARSDRARP